MANRYQHTPVHSAELFTDWTVYSVAGAKRCTIGASKLNASPLFGIVWTDSDEVGFQLSDGRLFCQERTAAGVHHDRVALPRNRRAQRRGRRRRDRDHQRSRKAPALETNRGAEGPADLTARFPCLRTAVHQTPQAALRTP